MALAGLFMVAKFGWSAVVTYSDISRDVKANFESDLWSLVIGTVLLFMSLILINNRTKKLESVISSTVIHVNGFSELGQDAAPLNALLKFEKINPYVYKNEAFNSYVTETVVQELLYYRKDLQTKHILEKCEKNYLAIIASIPFLYGFGCLLNKGANPHIEYLRKAESKWEKMDLTEPEEKKLVFTLNNKAGLTKDQALNEITENKEKDIGFVISFTQKILKEQLPESIRDDYLEVELNVQRGREVIRSQAVLEQIAREIHFVQTQLSAKRNKVHLFISAQANLVVDLGRLYQPGMSGMVCIHNYESGQNEYNWKLTITPKDNRPDFYVN